MNLHESIHSFTNSENLRRSNAKQGHSSNIYRGKLIMPHYALQHNIAVTVRFSGSLPLYVIHRYYIFVFIDRANKDACLLACSQSTQKRKTTSATHRKI